MRTNIFKKKLLLNSGPEPVLLNLKLYQILLNVRILNLIKINKRPAVAKILNKPGDKADTFAE